MPTVASKGSRTRGSSTGGKPLQLLQAWSFPSTDLHLDEEIILNTEGARLFESVSGCTM